MLPVPAEETATGTILVVEPAKVLSRAATLYARCPPRTRRRISKVRSGGLVAVANTRGLVVSCAVCEIGSRLNGRHPKKLLADPSVQTIVVEDKDRLMRFGGEYVEASLAAQGCTLVVANPGEVKDDLVRDTVEVLTSFCARRRGRRSARNRAQKALAAQ